MSLLFAGLPEDLGDVLVPRLTAQGDEVRVLENDPRLAERWRRLGAYIARGAADDPDLVMRAATNCRTLAALGAWASAESLEVVVEGARLAGVERVVAWAERIEAGALELLRGAGMQYVALSSARRGLLRRGAVAPADVAAAIDAADDLGGDVRLELDLTEAKAWTALGLEAPGGG